MTVDCCFSEGCTRIQAGNSSPHAGDRRQPSGGLGKEVPALAEKVTSTSPASAPMDFNYRRMWDGDYDAVGPRPEACTEMLPT